MARNTGADHLRLPSASIVGRDDLVGDVVDVVRSSALTTLTGVGGVGKTRLAFEVAGLLADEFVDGVDVVELAPVEAARSVPSAIASVLGITPRRDVSSITTAIAEALAGRHFLLVIDNCEHLTIATAAAVTTILDRAGTVSVLATSREPLWIAGEQRVSVGPLDLDGGVDSDAGRLFVERARAVRFGFEPDWDCAEAIDEICRRLDGIPLAIELAAARMGSMTAVELSERLDHRFRLLAGEAHRPERHQTLAAAVAWSCDLLGRRERSALDASAVFRGGFTVSDLAAVTGADDEIDLLADLDSLVNRSLVAADHRAGRTRYRLLETIRQFVEDQLPADRLGLLRERHATHFAATAADRWNDWNGPAWREVSDWIDAELSNLRAAFRWSADSSRLETATDIAAHAALMGVPVQLFETVDWAEEIIDAARAADLARLPRLYTAAGYACFAGRPELAAESARRATELESREGYDPCEPGLASFVEALARVYSGDLETYVELAGHVARLGGPARAYGLPAFVDGLQASGRVDDACALAAESVEAAREVGNPFWIAYALWTAGLAHAGIDPDRALAAWDEGVDVVRRHRVDFFEGFLARDAARLHAAGDAPHVALELYSAAIAGFRASGNVAQLVITVASVPALLERLGHLEAALSLHAAITQEPASLHHVPGLTALGDRLTECLDEATVAAGRAVSDGFDLTDTARLALEHITAARAQIDTTTAEEPPAGLTGRQLEVLELVADGLTTREIAEELFISVKTADHHIQHIYTKLGVSNRAAATRWALEKGVLRTVRPV